MLYTALAVIKISPELKSYEAEHHIKRMNQIGNWQRGNEVMHVERCSFMAPGCLVVNETVG